MNYGGNGIRRKKKLLNSSATKFRTKFNIFFIKLLLVGAIAVVISGSCLIFGAAQGIIRVHLIYRQSMFHPKVTQLRYTITMVKKYRRLQQPELTEYTLPLTRFQYIFSTHLLLLKMKDSTSITELTFRVL